MAKKTSSEELINHYGAVRLRLTGSGSLRMTLYSLDEVKSTTLLALPIQSTTNIEPTRLANFTQQRAKLMIKTTDINEVFEISKIIVFIKPVANSLPQTS